MQEFVFGFLWCLGGHGMGPDYAAWHKDKHGEFPPFWSISFLAIFGPALGVMAFIWPYQKRSVANPPKKGV